MAIVESNRLTTRFCKSKSIRFIFLELQIAKKSSYSFQQKSTKLTILNNKIKSTYKLDLILANIVIHEIDSSGIKD